MNGAMLKLNKVQNKMYVKSNNVPFYVVLFLLTILEFEFEANCEKQIPGPPTIEAPSVTTVFKGDTLRLKVNSIVHVHLGFSRDVYISMHHKELSSQYLRSLPALYIFQCVIKSSYSIMKIFSSLHSGCRQCSKTIF